MGPAASNRGMFFATICLYRPRLDVSLAPGKSVLLQHAR